MCKVLKCEKYREGDSNYCIDCKFLVERDHEYYLMKKKEEEVDKYIVYPWEKA